MIRLEARDDIHKTGRVARSFSLQDVSLVELQARRLVPIMECSTSPVGVRVEDKATAELGEGGDTLGVTVLFTVGVGTVEDDPATDVLRVSGTFELNYRRILEGAEVTPEDAGVFARINGFYNAWPYIREIVGSFFTRMGYPPLTLASLVIATRPDEPSAENKKR